MELQSSLLLLGVGVIAGLINIGAGGGSSLTLPALIFLGLDSAVANGTNRIALIIQNIFAITGFHQEKQNEFKQSFKYALFTLPGALAGAVLAVRLSDVWFQRILAVIMVLIVLTLFLPGTKDRIMAIEGKNSWLVYLALLGAGFYGGFIQVGVGFILMAILFHLAGLTLIKVNVHKVFIILLYTIPALAIFIYTDNVHWQYGLILAVGNGIGGWISARVSVKKGESYIRVILAAAIVIMAYKLIEL
ncbi:MAG: sulfite exporter TauE/SafE family protein [Calditrichaceae bacterium]|nr:sulfite exporter TauE/SafE family protein [Calditrichaceae bacterium]